MGSSCDRSKPSCCETASALPTVEHQTPSSQPQTRTDSVGDETLPVAILGAGPVGLAAAANLCERGRKFVVLEAGDRVAANMWQWRHVRLFTPWKYLIDPVGARLLAAAGNWKSPDPDKVPYAQDFVETFLDPVAALASIQPNIRLNREVASVSREGHDRMKDGHRNEAPFLITARSPTGHERIRASAVIDATGTWRTPNPLGAGGVAADGESEAQEHICYGMPDVLGHDRKRYAGKRVLVVGSGHSAIGNVLSLVELAKSDADTSVVWAIRRTNPQKLWGGGEADQIEERGELGLRVKRAVDRKEVTLLGGLSIAAVRRESSGLSVVDTEGTARTTIDEIIVSTGARPDMSMLRELRLEFDLATEASAKLGPLIDPNHHSCGSVPPHGEAELRQPERGFYLAGMKSYGRAPTFLLMTGYEQVRSIAAKLCGDCVAAENVELVLPETGVCSTDLATQEEGKCCSG
ncbi:MAG: NAD(P)-binding domain-containing protein [Rhodopirellula sp. JB044]|uniref:NAD(P)-binding domain-containing protein n=1 Tax=Rhodopirellula sp. JB044 TaxID=3342844 RepID=UPI00370BF5C9